FFQAEDGIRDDLVTGVQTCALPISLRLMRLAGRGNAIQNRERNAFGFVGLSDHPKAVHNRKQNALGFVWLRQWSGSIRDREWLEIGRASCRERGGGGGWRV